jgi:hypothetical protein
MVLDQLAHCFCARLLDGSGKVKFSIVCVAGLVPFGAVIVLWRGRPEGCVAFGSDPLPRLLYGVAMVVVAGYFMKLCTELAPLFLDVVFWLWFPK